MHPMPTSSLKQPDIGERRAAASIGLPFRSVLLAVGVFYVTAGLLNGHALHERVLRREYGRERSVWMAITAPLDQLSRAAGLHRFRLLFEPVLENTP